MRLPQCWPQAAAVPQIFLRFAAFFQMSGFSCEISERFFCFRAMVVWEALLPPLARLAIEYWLAAATSNDRGYVLADLLLALLAASCRGTRLRLCLALPAVRLLASPSPCHPRTQRARCRTALRYLWSGGGDVAEKPHSMQWWPVRASNSLSSTLRRLKRSAG